MKINSVLLAAAIVKAIKHNEFIRILDRDGEFLVPDSGTLRGFVTENMYHDHYPTTDSLVWITNGYEYTVPFSALLRYAEQGNLEIRISEGHYIDIVFLVE